MSQSVVDGPEFQALRQRMDQLEREMAAIRAQLAAPAPARPQGFQYSNKAEVIAVMRKVLAELGIPEQPDCTPQELRERMIRNGVDPEARLASRAIIEMREEW